VSARLILLLLVAAGIYLLLRWFVRTPPATVARYLRVIVVIPAIGLVLFLVASGRLNWIFALIAAVLPLLGRLLALARYLPFLRRMHAHYKRYKTTRNGGPRPAGHSQTSQVQTRFLRMTLDHAVGEITGVVLDGTFKNRTLLDLNLEELSSLLDECRTQDEDSVPLLEAYLDRRYGARWRDYGKDAGRRKSPPGDIGSMTREEAYEILGLAPGASEEDIISAHRRLIQKLHPDRGGSNYLAARINWAKDLLLSG
jgi:hypothetical protein